LQLKVVFNIIISAMYLCVCHAITVSEVETAVTDGATTREAVTRKCRAGGDCGACHAEIEQVIEDHANGLVPAGRLCHRAA
jgi:bacterioferritin-associated ferredoxin